MQVPSRVAYQSITLTLESHGAVNAHHIAIANEGDPFQGVGLLFVDPEPAEFEMPNVSIIN